MKWRLLYFVGCFITVFCAENIDNEPDKVEEFEVSYSTPSPPSRAYLAETFDILDIVERTWIKSNAKKSGVDEGIAKYDGEWSVEPAEKDALPGDLGLVLKSKAKHAAISARLKRPFIFKDKPFIVQYEVNLQNGQDCGGSYIKLISQPKNGEIDLGQFQDKTPYTIMFGPDKCGNDHKFHFIFRHVNPLNGSIEEKHCKRPKNKIEEPFKDKRPHLYTLILRPDNSYEVLVDHEEVNKGNLFEDFTPSINPPKDIDDPDDSRPSDWDDREKITDPNASKPDDWDENAPLQIKDEYAEKPEGWLEDESKLISDPKAEQPEDWDEEMDGDWSAPLVNNPKCDDAKGCGEWTAPLIDNPKYKGKWRPAFIDNPVYAGKWAPRRISNPGFYEDLEPFKMTAIGAVGIELWSMSNNIYFDNILVTDNEAEAKNFAAQTFDLKVLKIDKGDKGIIKRIVDYTNENPWIYGVYVLLLAIPAVLIFLCCCSGDTKEYKDAGNRKKTDEVEEDDPHHEEVAEEEAEAEGGEIQENSGDQEDEEIVQPKNDEQEEKEEEEEVDDKVESAEVDDKVESAEEEESSTRSSPRLRKQRQD